jgi:hypothetical protein
MYKMWKYVYFKAVSQLTSSIRYWEQVVDKIFLGYELRQFVKNYWCFRDHLCPHHQGLMRGTEMVPEMSVIFNQLSWLLALEEIIGFSHCEHFKFYILWECKQMYMKLINSIRYWE